MDWWARIKARLSHMAQDYFQISPWPQSGHQKKDDQHKKFKKCASVCLFPLDTYTCGRTKKIGGRKPRHPLPSHVMIVLGKRQFLSANIYNNASSSLFCILSITLVKHKTPTASVRSLFSLLMRTLPTFRARQVCILNCLDTQIISHKSSLPQVGGGRGQVDAMLCGLTTLMMFPQEAIRIEH